MISLLIALLVVVGVIIVLTQLVLPNVPPEWRGLISIVVGIILILFLLSLLGVTGPLRLFG